MSEPVEQRVDLRELVDGRAAERKRAQQAGLAAAIIGGQGPDAVNDDDLDVLVDLVARRVVELLGQPHDRQALWT